MSESSLEQDRSTKQRIYATAGVEQYVILNLPDRRAEVYQDPQPATGRYDSVRILTRDDVISLRLPGRQQLEIQVSQLLG